MAFNQQDQHFNSSSITEQPTIHYLSWGLRLLSDVASHVQRCSRCYAVEEESEHIHGGWAIATPNGVVRTSIVDHPVYMEITGDSTYFCVRCFDELFGGVSARNVPSFLLDGPNFKEVLRAPNSRQFLTDKEKQVFIELEEMRPIAGKDDKRRDYVGTNSQMEVINVIPYPPPGYEVGSWSQQIDRANLLISVPNEHLNGLVNLNISEKLRNEKVTETKFDEGESRLGENGKNIGNEGTSNGRKKGKQSGHLAHGQRCSRINGRGWQCQKITLPGYALCEYHLALARTRTMENKFK